jgi:peptidoglycan/xylan/chitin deacetylase (PgdA/CDA1 family)
MMTWLLKVPAWRGVLTLAYHRIGDAATERRFDADSFTATQDALDAQIAIVERDFEVVTPEAIGQTPDVRGRRVSLTFDDGYRDNYELALPVLRKHGVPATFFLATRFLDQPRVPWWDELAWMTNATQRSVLPPGEWLGRPLLLEDDRRHTINELLRVYKSLPSDRAEAFLEYCGSEMGVGRCDAGEAEDLWMTWQMAAELRDAGMTIGGHTATHPVLARSSLARQRREIDECARRLREELGLPMRFFAYPVGLSDTFDRDTRRIVEDAGVELAFSFYGGHLRPGRLDPLNVPRAGVPLGGGLSGFRAVLALPSLFGDWW